MKFRSIRLFGSQNARPGRRVNKNGTARLARLTVEQLEKRELLSVTLPKIVAVSPANGSATANAQPVITITFNEAMNAGQAQNTANYSMFDAKGNPVRITGATYNNSNFTVTLTDAGNFPGGQLVREKYSIFVRGDQIHDAAADNLPLAQPGQLFVGDSGTGNVSLVSMPGDGTLSTSSVINYGTSAINTVLASDLNGDGIPDIVIANPLNHTVTVFLSQPGGGYGSPIALSVGTDPIALALAPFFNDTQ
jgi:hypothetical protein